MTLIQGSCLPGWESLHSAITELHTEYGPQGLGLCVFQNGELQANVWSGCRDKKDQLPWQEQTLVNIFSASKGPVALCVLKLADEGRLSLDTPIAHYWPEFAAKGKGSIRVRDVLCHRSGVGAFREKVDDAAIYNWSTMITLIEQQEPWFEPDSTQAYSPFIYGWILGELVRRVAGTESFNRYFQSEIAEPLGLNFHFGVPEGREVADIGPLKTAKPAPSNLTQTIKSDPGGMIGQSFTNPISLIVGTNSQAWREAEIPAANGHTNAYSLAAIYGAIANRGIFQGRKVLSESILNFCEQELSCADDEVLLAPLKFSYGFMMSGERRDCYFGSPRGFGHPGAGGCLGFADPARKLGVGFVTNRVGQELLVDQRVLALIEAIYACEGLSDE